MMALEGDGCLWWRLFSSGDYALRLWTCLRGWRAVAVRKKRRFVQLTPREQLDVEFVEDDLPLHAVVSCIGEGDKQVQTLRIQWVRRILDLLPTACELLDRDQRAALHYALAQRWQDLDHLSWLCAKSQPMLLHKDAEGRSLITQAILHNCPQEVIMLMAVELARRSLESVEALLEGRHLESARRLCRRMIREYFAGVPQFPHAYCLHLLQNNEERTVVDGLQTVWRDFVDKWGYYGMPLVVDDLPYARHVALDSFLQLSIKAKGEPLAYQWFCDNEPVPGATQATLFVSQCVQPHNEGAYFCEVTNWKGRAVSTVMELVVVDDAHGPDPSLRFLLHDDDRASLSEGQIVHRIAASRGGLVHAPLGNQAIMAGCSLLLPPKCFVSFDANGVDVSDTIGMDVVMRPSTEEVASPLLLTRDEKLVSLVIDVLPFHIPALAQPAILSIPHCWCANTDSIHELVVVEIPLPDDRTTQISADRVGRTSAKDTSRKQTYEEVDQSRLLEANYRGDGVVSFEISHFGRFAVLARSITSENKENDSPLEDVVLCITHPNQLSTAHELEKNPAVVPCAVWLALNRSDTLAALHQMIQEQQRQRSAGDKNRVATSSKRFSIREGQVLFLRLGLKETISHVWRGTGQALANTADGVVCLRSGLPLRMHEFTIDPQSTNATDNSLAIFRVLELKLVVLKPPRYQSRASSRHSTGRKVPQPDGLVMSETDWKIFLPTIHDAPRRPPQPVLRQRRPNQFAVAYDSATGTSGNAKRQALTLFEDVHEMERDFSPYFYEVEIARFTETFWQRYDRTWWFDKTKSEILSGMYRTAHTGTEPFAVIASDAFAGAIRVAQCSLDARSQYCEPYLLEPAEVATDTTGGTSGMDRNDREDDDDDEHVVPSGLRKVLTLPAALDVSLQRHASLDRLRAVLDSVYNSFPHESFLALFGTHCNLDAVRLHLEMQHGSVRAANYEVALLVLAMDRIAHRIGKRILLRSQFYRRFWGKLQMLRRLLPEIDCFPVEYNAVMISLHTLVRDLFEIVLACSSPDWLARFLRNEWFEAELQAIVARILRVLYTEAQPLLAANEVAEALEAFVVGEDDGSGLTMERTSLRSLREYMLLVIGQPLELNSAREIATLLRQFIPPCIRDKTMLEDWEDLVVSELQSEATARAVQYLRDHDTLAAHFRSATPHDHERFSGVSLPTRISFHFGVQVVHVDTQHALKVTNATLRCGVQGQVEFSRQHKRLVFVPALPFDKHMRYQVKLRAQYVHTALGGALPPRSSMVIEFSTSA